MNNRCSGFCAIAMSLATLGGVLAADLDFATPHATYATGVGPRTVAIGRLDTNTANDLVVGNATSNTISVLLNNGSGIFGAKTDFAVPGNPSSVAVVDLNGDSKNDVVVASQFGTGFISVFLGNGDGTLQTRTDFTASAALVAMRLVDVDGDAKLDVIAGGTGIDYFKGDGLGGFAPVVRIMTSGYTNSVTVGDLNGDGRIDIACTNAGRLTTLFGNGNGAFAPPVTYDTGAEDLSVGMGDFNGDGLNDLAETHYYGPAYEVAVLLNLGAGTFGPAAAFATGVNPKALMIADLDADGHQDLACVNVASHTVGILRGKGDGTFHPHFGYLTGGGPYVDAIGDLDGNGSLDVAAANTVSNNVSVLLQGTGGAPGPVVNLSATLVTDHHAQLSWTTPTVESYGPLTAYDLRIKSGTMVAGDFPSASPVLPAPSVLPTGITATQALAGLLPNTTYSLALKVTDAFGRVSPLSNIITFTTAATDTTPPSAPTLSLTAYGTSGSQSYAVLRWIAPGDDGVLGVASAYDLRISTTPITDDPSFAGAASITTAAPSPAGQQEEVTVTGLTAGATYYVAITASDEAPLTSSRSSTLTVIPPAVDAIDPGRITDLAVVATTATTATLRWTAQGDDGLLGGPATAFDVRWCDRAMNLGIFTTLGVPVASTPVPGAAGTVHEVVVTGLPDQTLCYFALVVADEVPNTSPLSNLVSTTTPDGTAPDSITDLAITAITAGSLTLTWTAPGDDHAAGTAAAYDVRYSAALITDANFASASAAVGVATPQTTGSGETLTITGLAAGTTYQVAIRSRDEVANLSALSNIATGTTTGSSGGGSGGGGNSSSGGGCGLGSGLATMLLLTGLLLTTWLRPRYCDG